nr:immunoglobulin heavy chain junction region [Macaca mulatta]
CARSYVDVWTGFYDRFDVW